MFAWICPKCGKEIPPQYDGCPEWCPEYEKQKAYLKQTSPATVEVTSPVLKNLRPLDAPLGGGATYTGATYTPGAMLPPPRPDGEAPPEALRYRPAASAIAYETALPQSGASARSNLPPISKIRDRQPASEKVSEGGREMNPFLVTLLATVAFLALGYAAFKYYEQSKAPIGFPAGTVDSSGANGGHRLNRILSFSGMRFAPGRNKQLEAQFVLVNSSAAQTPTFSGTVEIRPKDAPAGEKPILAFELSKVSLGPHESQQMQIPLNTALKLYEMPDGDMVRADLTITDPAQ